jgi:hypothetical protein
VTRRYPSRVVVLALLGALSLPVLPVAAVAEPAPSATGPALSTPESPPTGRTIGPLAPPASGRPGSGPGGCEPIVDEPTSGQDAIDELGADLPAVARGHGRPASELRSTLRRDPTLHVDPCGFLFFVDGFGHDGHASHEHDQHDQHDQHDDPDGETEADGREHHQEAAPGPTDGDVHGGHDHAAAGSVGSGVLAANPPAPLEDTFALHSRPGSDRTIYLDFTGHDLVRTGWNGLAGVFDGFHLPAFSLDGDPTFSAAERAVIQAVWQHVAEDFAPFDVDVTTEDPGEAALKRSSLLDQAFGARAVITSLPDPSLFCRICAGLGYLGSFDGVDGSIDYRTSLVFASRLPASDVGRIAITVSHEVGHNFNLLHHGDASGEYTSGQGMWAPIMGAAGWRPLSTWSRGDYRDATNTTQDDIAWISARGAPLAPDDHGTTRQTATELVGAGDLAGEGVIGTRHDQDWFRFTAGGLTTISAQPAPVGPNLDVELLVTDADGTLLAVEDPLAAWPGCCGSAVTGLGAEVVRDLAPGTYYARVRGVGAGDPSVDGYSDYGSLGRYTLSVTTTHAPAVAPVVQITSGPPPLTGQRSASLAFVADVPEVSFECRLDAGAWAACSSPWSLTDLADGLRTASVRATAAGVTSAVTSRSWTIDTVAPTVTITGGPAQGSSTTATSASFSLTASEAGVRYECRVGAATWQPCTSPASYAGLTVGSHTFRVRGTDPAGNLGPVSSRSWTVTAPIVAPPPAAPPAPAPAPTFTDVPSSSPHAVNIGKLAARGVTLGCGGTRYCPDDDVSREQMATFLVRALKLAEGSSRPPFSDVAAGSTHARSIDAMRREEITLGCGGGRFCPSTSVPRDQMASFLQRALPLEPGSASPPFPDVRAGSTHARAIDAVRRAEITLGCPGGGYCPGDTVTRAQMASFLVRALEVVTAPT